MPILVDGDNLLGTWGRKRSTATRRELAMQLARLGAGARKRIITVFDGPTPGAPAFGANVQFSGAGRAADDLILEILRAAKDKAGWLVVTSDRSLSDQCRWLGARTERCDRFRGRLEIAEDAEKPECEEQIDYWLTQFSGEDEGPSQR